MNSAKLPKHSDLDSEVMPLVSPFRLALHLGCLATLLMTAISWLLLLGVMTAGMLPWLFWPYIALPIAGWVILLGWPAMFKARRGALVTLDALAQTAEAWLARAGYSIDLNNDSYIGHVQPVQIEPPQTQMVTPAILSGLSGVKLLTNESEAIPQIATQQVESVPAVPRRVWDLPGGVKCPEETVRHFVERIFIIGWGRGEWVGAGKPLERDVYDALLNLLVQTQLIEGRKAGHAGKLTVDNPQTALQALGLMARPEKPTAAPAGDLMDRYESI